MGGGIASHHGHEGFGVRIWFWYCGLGGVPLVRDIHVLDSGLISGWGPARD